MHIPESAGGRKSAPPLARSHFTMIPDMVGDLELDPYTFRLYCHIRRVVGDSGPGPGDTESGSGLGDVGACWQSTATLAATCRMSAGKVSQSKRKLVQQGLIRIEKRLGLGGYHDHITLVNIWPDNRSHFDRTPAPPSPGEEHAASVHPADAGIPTVNTGVHPVNPMPSPGEEHAASVHLAETGVHRVNAMPSPCETIHIPLNQNSSSRKEEDDDDDPLVEKEKGRENQGSGDQEREGAHLEAESRAGAHPETMALVSTLYRRELAPDPSPLQREEIADLVALCDDPAVWRHAFLRSAGARNRWAYITRCIRNAASERGGAPDTGAVPTSQTTAPQTVPPQTAVPPHVERWAQVLEVLSWKLPESIYREGFARTTCIGERDGGKTWDVIVPRPAFLGWIQQPSHTPLVDKALRRCGFTGITVNFIPPPAT